VERQQPGDFVWRAAGLQRLREAERELALHLHALEQVRPDPCRAVEAPIREDPPRQRAVMPIHELHRAHRGAHLPADDLPADQRGYPILDSIGLGPRRGTVPC